MKKVLLGLILCWQLEVHAQGFYLCTQGLSLNTGSIAVQDPNNSYKSAFTYYGLGVEMPFSIASFLYNKPERKFRIGDLMGANAHLGYAHENYTDKTGLIQEQKSGGYYGIDLFAGGVAGYRISKNLDVSLKWIWSFGGRQFNCYNKKEFDRKYHLISIGSTYKRNIYELQFGSRAPSKQFAIQMETYTLASWKRIYGKKSHLFFGFHLIREKFNTALINSTKNPWQVGFLWGTRL